MREVGKPSRRSKAAPLAALKRDLGKQRIGHLDRQKLINYGPMRAEQSESLVTMGADKCVLKVTITHAAATHLFETSPEPVDIVHIAKQDLPPKNALPQEFGSGVMEISLGHMADQAKEAHIDHADEAITDAAKSEA